MTSREASPVTDDFVAAICNLRPEDVPPTVRREACLSLLDAAGEALAGSVLAHPALVGLEAVAAASSRSAPDVAMLLTARAVAGLRDALHVETTVHAPAVIFGTLVALVRTHATPGRAFLAAYIAGVEAACRLADALDPAAVYGRSFHPTAICGALGAAVSAARLLDLRADRLEAAIGLALQMASGHTVWMRDQSDGSRPLSAAGAARTGTMAALLAAHGVGGRTAALDGAESLFQTYSAAPRRERLLHDWGKRYYVAELTYKLHASCTYTHAAVDGLLELLAHARESGIGPEAVVSIAVGLPAAAYAITTRPALRSCFAPYVLALAAVDGAVDIAGIMTDRGSEPGLAGMMSRITLYEAAEIPPGGATVTVLTTDGARRTKTLEAARGSRVNPLPDSEIIAKFNSAASQALSGQAVATLRQQLLAIDSLPDASNIFQRE